MSDLYRELLVKRESRPKDKLVKALMIVLTVLSGAAMLLTPWAGAVLLIMGVVDYIVFPTFDLEFEYLYVNGELDVDKIISKTKRKRAASYDMGKMELIAPWNSHELDYHKKECGRKVTDFSSGRKDAKVYAMVYVSEKGKELVLFEPDQIILNDIQRIAPRKVKLS